VARNAERSLHLDDLGLIGDGVVDSVPSYLEAVPVETAET